MYTSINMSCLMTSGYSPETAGDDARCRFKYLFNAEAQDASPVTLSPANFNFVGIGGSCVGELVNADAQGGVRECSCT